MNIYDIRDYGAVSGSGNVCTDSIQRAIDMCCEGGTVYIPDGVFVSGTIYLKSGMALRVVGTLAGSGSIGDFPVKGYPYEGLDQLCYASLINTDGAPHKNITIEGRGVIDANGKALFDAEMKDERVKRGRAVYFKNITVDTKAGYAVYMCGLPERHFKNISMENIRARGKYGIKVQNIDNLQETDVDIKGDDYEGRI